jgi:ribosomal protein S18 acetylase RimI-like enzyme
MSLTTRPATEADLSAITRLDLTYPTDRYLALERSGAAPEHTFSLRWRNRVPEKAVAVYADYNLDGLRGALAGSDLFLVAEIDSEIVGLLMIIMPEWTDAAEIADLAVDIASRRLGAGRALVETAADWARERSDRSLWVEPRADNFEAISFYVSLGFRVAGFNDRMYSNRDHEDGRPTVFMHLELA